MSDETLEEKIEKQENDKKFSIWDFLVSAYSSSRGIKAGLLTAAAGCSYQVVAATAIGFYLAAKTMGTSAKHFVRILNPMKYFSFKEMIYETIKSYNPFGRYKRPTFMGATLSTIGYATGF